MALLTNINGKFSVDTDGAASFNRIGASETTGFTFPSADGANGEVLKTNGLGTVSWLPDSNTGTVTGTGVANKVAYWTSATSIDDGPITFATNNSTFAGNVTLDQSVNTSSSVNISNLNSGSASQSRFVAVSDGGNIQLKSVSIANTTYGAGDAGVINCDTMSGGFRIAHNDVTKYTLAFNGENTWTGGGTFGGNVIIHSSSNAPYIDFVENADTTDSKARIAMDQIDGSNGELIFSTEGAGTLYQGIRINSQRQTWLGGTFTGANIATSNASYLNNLNAGGFSILHRNAADVYLHFNSYYNSSNVYEAKYGGAQGFRIDSGAVANGLGFYKAPVVTNAGDTQTFSHVMRIGYGANNNVGIGTTTPDMKIDVEDSSTTWAGRVLNTNAGGAGLLIRSDATNNASVLGVYGNGSYRMLVQANGNVGIGTTSPDTTLEVKNPTLATDTVNTLLTQRWSRSQTGSVKWGNSMDLLLGSYESGTINSRTRVDFKLANGATDDPDTTVMTLQANGNVGIGTTSPQTPLQLEKTASAGTSRTALVNLMYLTSEHPSTGYTGFGTAITHYSRTYQNSTKTEQSKIAFTQQGDSTSTAGSTIDFYTKTLSTGSAAPELRMRINYNGNVGIGTLSPGYKLQVQGTGYYSGQLTVDGFAGNSGISFRTGISITNVGIRAKAVGTTNRDGLELLGYNGIDFTVNSGLNVAMRIVGVTGSGMGNVGIGTLSPGARLHVLNTGNYESIRIGNSQAANVNKQGGITSLNYIGNSTSIFQYATNAGANVVYYGSADGSFRGLTQHSFMVSSGADTVSHSQPLKLTAAKVTMAADVTMTGSVGIGETTLQRKFNLYDGTDTWTRTRCGASAADWLNGIAGSDTSYKWYNQQNAVYAMQITATTTPTLTVKGDIIAYGSPSDKRLKENIKPIKSALDKVSKLQGVTFDWKKSDSILDIKEDIGFIAQDVQKVIPELVRESEDGMLSMRHQGIAPILLEAIKELKAEIEELKLNKCNCNCNK